MNPKNYISMVEFLMGRDAQYPLTPEMVANANTLLPRVNDLLEKFYAAHSEPIVRRSVNSGYRPGLINSQTPGAAKASKHMICAAVDLSDNDKKLGTWCVNNLQILENLGLWMEDLGTTHAKDGACWTHLQCIPPKSGNRVFKP